MELAWQVHFERLKQQPGGCETVACVSRRLVQRGSCEKRGPGWLWAKKCL